MQSTLIFKRPSNYFLKYTLKMGGALLLIFSIIITMTCPNISVLLYYIFGIILYKIGIDEDICVLILTSKFQAKNHNNDIVIYEISLKENVFRDESNTSPIFKIKLKSKWKEYDLYSLNGESIIDDNNHKTYYIHLKTTFSHIENLKFLN